MSNPRPNKYADLILEPVWVSWCRKHRNILQRAVDMHRIEPLYLKVIFKNADQIEDEDLADLIAVLDVTLNELDD